MTASYPWPAINISWPGRIESEVSSFGAPKNIVGIKSIKICVIDKEAIKIINEIGGKNCKSAAEIVKRKSATRFIWIPGTRPVIVPIETPRIRAIISSRNILLFIFEEVYIFYNSFLAQGQVR